MTADDGPRERAEGGGLRRVEDVDEGAGLERGGRGGGERVEQPQQPSCPLAQEQRQPASLLAEAQKDMRDLCGVVQSMHCDVQGNLKPRIGPWTFKKDMALILQFYAELQGKINPIQVANICSLPPSPLPSLLRAPSFPSSAVCKYFC